MGSRGEGGGGGVPGGWGGGRADEVRVRRRCVCPTPQRHLTGASIDCWEVRKGAIC